MNDLILTHRQFYSIQFIDLRSEYMPKGAKRGAQHRVQLFVLYLDAQIKEKPQDVDVCRERKVLGVTSGDRCR